MSDENKPVGPENPTLAQELRMPFEDEGKLMVDTTAMRDNLTIVQTEAHGAARMSGEHVSHLLYDSREAGHSAYIYDPHSSPDGVSYYPAYPDTPDVAQGDQVEQEKGPKKRPRR